MSLSYIAVLNLLKARVAGLEILDHRTGANTGVTPGGFHIDPADNTPWYVKHHNNSEHAFSEHLTNQVYRALGHAAPHSMVLHKHDGAPVYFSKIIPGFRTLQDHEAEFAKTPAFREHMAKWEAKHPGRGYDPAKLWRPHAPEVAHRFLGGMSADLLVNNSDLHHANVGLIHGKVPARIDNGSNMVHDAHGNDRDTYHSTMPTWDHTAAAIHAFGTEDRGADDAIEKTSFRRPQVKKILDLRDQHGGWQHFVDKHIPGASASLRDRATDALHARTNMLAHAVGLPTAHAMMKSSAGKPLDRSLDLVKARVANLEILNNKTGAQGGITAGGFHQDPADGTPWYVKHHSSPTHAFSEHLSNQIYRDLGHGAPHSMVLHKHDGSPVYFSKIIPGFKTLDQHYSEWNRSDAGVQHRIERAKQGPTLSPDRGLMWRPHHQDVSRAFLSGVAADHLVGNKDLHELNVGLVNGKAPARIDNGANFMHTAQGVERGRGDSAKVNIFNTDVVAQHVPAAVHALGAGKEHTALLSEKFLKPQVKRIVELGQRHGGWDNYVEKHIPGAPAEFKSRAADAMHARVHTMASQVGVAYHPQGRHANAPELLQPVPPKPTPVTPAPAAQKGLLDTPQHLMSPGAADDERRFHDAGQGTLNRAGDPKHVAGEKTAAVRREMGRRDKRVRDLDERSFKEARPSQRARAADPKVPVDELGFHTDNVRRHLQRVGQMLTATAPKRTKPIPEEG